MTGSWSHSLCNWTRRRRAWVLALAVLATFIKAVPTLAMSAPAEAPRTMSHVGCAMDEMVPSQSAGHPQSDEECCEGTDHTCTIHCAPLLFSAVTLASSRFMEPKPVAGAPSALLPHVLDPPQRPPKA